jgi:hypothetical protein
MKTMGRIRSNTPDQTSPQVTAAQADVNRINQELFDLGVETAKLVASSSPVGGQIVDGASAVANLAAGNWGAAFLDGLGMIPLGGDALKGAIRGTKIAKALSRAQDALKAAEAALSRAKGLAKTRAAAKTYWDALKKKRDDIIKKYKGCKTEACAKARDDELRAASRLPKSNGKWVDKDGKPAPAGSGYWKPDEGSELHKTLSRHQDPVKGVPFEDGKPDFSGFPPKGMDKVHQVEIEMKGNSTSDITDAKNALIAKGGPDTRGSGQPGTWHHEPNGTTMSYVDKDVHTAYQRADGTANPGTPHMGGDSMTRDPEF